MKIILPVLGFLGILSSSQASPFPPSPKCQAKIKIVKNIGLKSTLHADILKLNDEQRPHSCKTADDLKRHFCESAQIQILENLGTKEPSPDAATCPKMGSTLVVCLPTEKINGIVRVEIEYRGDECFSAYFLSLHK